MMEENRNQKQNIIGPIIIIICLLVIIIRISSYLINNIPKNMKEFELPKFELPKVELPDISFNNNSQLDKFFIETEKTDNKNDNDTVDDQNKNNDNVYSDSTEKTLFKKAYNSEELINIIKDYTGIFFNYILCIEINKNEAIIKTTNSKIIYIELIDLENWSNESFEKLSEYLNDNFAGINGVYSSYFVQRGSINSGTFYKEKDNTYVIDLITMFTKDGSSIRLIIDEDTLNRFKTIIHMEEIVNTIN